jgi:hypothetical protein
MSGGVIVSSPKSAGNTLEALRPAASARRKVPPDFYTGLLAIALAALLIAILFLWLYVKEYDYKTKAPPMPMAFAAAPQAASRGNAVRLAGEPRRPADRFVDLASA